MFFFFLLLIVKRRNYNKNIIYSYRPQLSNNASYENIDDTEQVVELHTLGSMLMEPDGISETERMPLDARQRRPSMRRLVRQASTVNTQKAEGAMKLTYWF